MSSRTGDQVEQQLAHLGVGMWELSAADQVVVLDRTARALLGVSEDLTPQQIMGRVPAADRAELMGAFGTPGSLQRAGCDFRYLREDGEEISLRMLASIENERAGGIMYLLEEPVKAPGGRSQWLGEFTEALSSALTPYDVARVLQTKGAELLGATYAGISEVSADGKVLDVLSTEALTLPVKQRWSSTPVDDDSPAARVYREERGFVYPSRERFLAVYPNLAAECEESGVRAWAGMPLVVSGRVIGVLALYWLEEREFRAEDVQFLQTLAGQCAQTLERSRMYEKQQEFGQALQKAVLPDELPELPGVEIAGRHLSAERGPEMGGDWYDAFQVPDNGLTLVVGDVVGRGGSTAALMGQLRNAGRAYALEGYSPAEMLSRLNHLTITMYPGQYATVLCAQLQADGSLAWANAGHPAMLLEVEGETREVGRTTEPLLGAVEEQQYTEGTLLLPEGGTLLLYSDGLLPSGESAGAEQLGRAALAKEHPILEVRCSQILEAVIAERAQEDDLSLLVLRRQRREDCKDVLRLPSTLQSPGEAREFVSRRLREWGAAELEDAALLLVSEVVTNAVIHARSAPRLTLSLDSEHLVVSVHDNSPLPPVRRRATLSATSGRGMALVQSMAAQWGVNGSHTGKEVWFYLERGRVENDLDLIDSSLLEEIAALTGEPAQ